MDQPTCADCLWFVRHYIRIGSGYTAIRSGLCCQRRGKIRKCSDPICKRYCDKNAFLPTK